MANFDIKNYSSKGWEKIKSVYNDANDVISSSWYKGESYKLDKKLKKKLDKVKTVKEEKAEKAKKKDDTKKPEKSDKGSKK